jgi:hypothetical protein
MPEHFKCGGFILRDAAKKPLLRMRFLKPHGEERVFARLEP